jgi:cation transport regulator ChaC
LSRTIRRTVDRRTGFAPARLAGYGRRWNYGSLHQRGDWHGPYGYVESGIVISLGLALSASEQCNGAVVRVTDEELALLDWRERDYERTEVTDRILLDDVGRAGIEAVGQIVTYVPRPSAIERYEQAKESRRAAVRRSYRVLVEAAFGQLGDHHLDDYRSSTAEPDVPVVDFA